MSNIKQVIILRRDLNMRLGKSCSQVAHASTKVFFDRMKDCDIDRLIKKHQNMQFGYPCSVFHSCKKDTFVCEFTSEMIEWTGGSFIPEVVDCNSEQELFELRKQAKEEGIVNALILDNGNTEFKQECPDCKGSGNIEEITMGRDISINCEQCNGTGKINKPTYTCLAIGPDFSDKIDKITGGLKLL